MRIQRNAKNLAIGLVRNIPLTDEIIDGTVMTDDEIIDEFYNFTSAFEEEFVKDLFYGGIATDISERDKDHGMSGHILCIDVGTPERCTEIERRLTADLKVYIGKKDEDSAGNGVRPTTHLVYLLPRCHKDFKE